MAPGYRKVRASGAASGVQRELGSGCGMGGRDVGCHGAGRSSGGRLLEHEHRIRHFLTQSHGARAAWGAEALCPLQGAAKAAQGAAHAERPGKGRPVRTVEGRGLPGSEAGCPRPQWWTRTSWFAKPTACTGGARPLRLWACQRDRPPGRRGRWVAGAGAGAARKRSVPCIRVLCNLKTGLKTKSVHSKRTRNSTSADDLGDPWVQPPSQPRVPPAPLVRHPANHEVPLPQRGHRLCAQHCRGACVFPNFHINPRGSWFGAGGTGEHGARFPPPEPQACPAHMLARPPGLRGARGARRQLCGSLGRGALPSATVPRLGSGSPARWLLACGEEPRLPDEQLGPRVPIAPSWPPSPVPAVESCQARCHGDREG